MTELFEEKKRLRSLIRKKMRKLPQRERQQIDLKICERAAALPVFQEAETIFCFVGCDWEIDTTALINEAFRLGKKVAVPLCTGEGIMEARLIGSKEELRPGAYGIPEPPADSPLCKPDKIKLAVVPCVACDLHGMRLGQGGGFYDRFLKKTACYTVALCKEAAILTKIPAETWDLRMDCILTERRIVL